MTTEDLRSLVDVCKEVAVELRDLKSQIAALAEEIKLQHQAVLDLLQAADERAELRDAKMQERMDRYFEGLMAALQEHPLSGDSHFDTMRRLAERQKKRIVRQ